MLALFGDPFAMLLMGLLLWLVLLPFASASRGRLRKDISRGERGWRQGIVVAETTLGLAIIGFFSLGVWQVLVSARTHAQGVRCLSNMKALGRAFFMYEQDWNDMLPPANR